MAGEVWRISLRPRNGTEVVMETQGVGTRTPPPTVTPARRQTCGATAQSTRLSRVVKAPTPRAGVGTVT